MNATTQGQRLVAFAAGGICGVAAGFLVSALFGRQPIWVAAVVGAIVGFSAATLTLRLMRNPG